MKQSMTSRGRLISSLSLAVISLVLVSNHINAIEAIVKHSQPSQQSRSDDSSSLSLSSSSSIANNYNNVNHQSPSSTQQQQQQQPPSASYAPSQPISSSSYAPGAQQVARSSNDNSQQMDSTHGNQNAYQTSGSQKYADNMAAAASNPELSYQAAAQSVQMALANSSLYNSGPSSSSSSSSSSGGALDPLHYFYYPSRDTPSQAGSSSGSYAGPSSPEAAASNQDASYLPQPTDANNNNNNQNGPLPMYAPQQQMSSQPGGNNNNNNNNHHQQQPQAQPQYNEMNSFNGIPHASAGSVSFNGPTSSGNSQPQQQQQQHHHSASPPVAGYQNNQFDLSALNWANNDAMQPVASYMAANGNQQAPELSSLFNSMNIQYNQQNQQPAPFSSAASQLSPSAVAPPSQPASGSSSIFGAASSLFNSQPQPQPQQQQQPQQTSTTGNSLFSSPSYLNSFLANSAGTQGNLFANDQTLASLQSLLNPAGSASNQGSILPSGGSPPAASASSAPSSSSSSSSSKRFGLGSVIMPVLALAGLSLLIPTMSNIGTAVGRKKRSIVEERAQQVSAGQLAKETSIGEYMDRIERYYGLYKNAVENDDCLNRLICEFGDAVKDITGKSAVVTVIEKLVPNWMAGKMHLFKEAALDNREAKEKCRKYTCHNEHRQQ